MATHTETITTYTDDLDGSEATATVRFALDGRAYEIDLNDKNATALRKALDKWVEHARRDRTGKVAVKPKVERDYDLAAVREWADTNGIEVSRRGRIPAEVIDKYRAAMG